MVSYFHSYKTVFDPGQGLRDWAILENIQTEVVVVQDIESQRYSRNSIPNFQELIKYQSINQPINVFQGKIQTVQFTDIYINIYIYIYIYIYICIYIFYFYMIYF